MEGIPLLVILFILARILARLAPRAAPRGPVRKVEEPVPPPWVEEIFGRPRPARTLRVARPRLTPPEPKVAAGEGVWGGQGPHGREPATVKDSPQVTAPAAPAFLAGVSGDVARGLVMAEVLGPPMALRRQGPLRVR